MTFRRAEVLLVAFAQLITVIGTITSLKIFTNVLSMEEFGKFSLCLAIIAGIQLIFSAFGNALLRYFPEALERNDLMLYYESYKDLVIISLLITIMVIIPALFIITYLDYNFALTLLTILVASLTGINSWTITILTAMRLRKKVLILTFANYLIRPVLVLFSILYFQNKAEIVLVSYFLLQIFLLPVNYFFLKSSYRASIIENKCYRRTHTNYLKEFYGYGQYFLVAGIFVSIIAQSDRFIISELIGLNAVAGYTAMLMIATFATNFINSFLSQLMTPIIFQNAGEMQSRASMSITLNHYYFYTLLIYLSCILFVYFFKNTIVNIMTDSEFVLFSNLLPILLIAQCLEKYGQVITLSGFVQFVTWPYLFPRILQLIAFLISVVYLVGSEGLAGVAYSQFLAAVIYVLATVYTNKKHKKFFE